jgi:Flp pilus assembly protein TadB
MKEREETYEGLELRAYALGLKLKNSGLDGETIYARLEKQGIPEDLAKEVASNVIIERKKQTAGEQKPFFHVALLRIGVGLLLALVFAILFPDYLVIPYGFIIGSIVLAIAAKARMK